MTARACEHCGTTWREVCWSVQLAAWVCLRCYRRGTVDDKREQAGRLRALLAGLLDEQCRAGGER